MYDVYEDLKVVYHGIKFYSQMFKHKIESVDFKEVIFKKKFVTMCHERSR